MTASPGAQTLTVDGSTLSANLTGLTNGMSYTFIVTTINTVGTGASSSTSNPVTPATVPGAPANVSSTAGNTQAMVSWSAPSSTGGSTITAYTVTASPGGATASWSSGALAATVTGLTNDTSYSFTVTATNAKGNSPASSPSNAVTPAPTPTPPPTWAYGKDKYSFIETITISPTSGTVDTLIAMTCTATGLQFPSIELIVRNESGHERMFAESTEGWKAYGQCYDHIGIPETGTYSWVSLVLRSTENFRTTYTPDGKVKDHDGNVVESHSLSIPQVVIN